MSDLKIDRRSFLKTVGGVSASMLLPPGAELKAGELSPRKEALPRKKPNFLVVVADDQCFRTINSLNNREVHTPTFDRLLKRGATFTHCFHQGSWTGAVCVASRAMLHTGRYVWTCGGNNCGYVTWNSPHDPRQAPKEFVDVYPANKIEVLPNFLP